jgi:hypothetical protein
MPVSTLDFECGLNLRVTSNYFTVLGFEQNIYSVTSNNAVKAVNYF